MSVRGVRWPAFAVVAVTALLSCGSDPDDAYYTGPSSSPPSLVPGTTTATTTLPQAEIVVPPGILAAVPFQNRLDVAQGIFR